MGKPVKPVLSGIRYLVPENPKSTGLDSDCDRSLSQVPVCSSACAAAHAALSRVHTIRSKHVMCLIPVVCAHIATHSGSCSLATSHCSLSSSRHRRCHPSLFPLTVLPPPLTTLSRAATPCYASLRG